MTAQNPPAIYNCNKFVLLCPKAENALFYCKCGLASWKLHISNLLQNIVLFSLPSKYNVIAIDSSFITFKGWKIEGLQNVIECNSVWEGVIECNRV